MKDRQKLQIVIVSGKKNAGKTKYLQEIRQRAAGKGWDVGGFLSIARWENNEKSHYFLFDLQNAKEHLLAWKSDKPAALRIGQYELSASAFDWGTNLIRSQLHLPVLILDEFGPLEMQEKGWYKALLFLLKHYRGILFISVRPDLLSPLLHLIKSELNMIVKQT